MKKLIAILLSTLLLAALLPASVFAESQSVTLNTSYNTTVNRDGTAYITVSSKSSTDDGYTLEIVPSDTQITVVSGNSGIIHSTETKTTIFQIKGKSSADIGAHKIVIEARSSEIDVNGNSFEAANASPSAVTTTGSATSVATTAGATTAETSSAEASSTPAKGKLLQSREVSVMVVDNSTNYYGPAQTATNVSYTLSSGDSIDAKVINSITVTFFNRSNVSYRNCELSIKLPSGMSIYSGAGSVYVGNVSINKTCTASFPVVCDSTLKNGSYEITATLNGGYYDYSYEEPQYVKNDPLTQTFYVPVRNGADEEEEEETTTAAIDVAKPILMVSNYSCGGSVIAGKNFGLNLTLLNTSKVTLRNIKVTLDPATGIVPVGSSNSFYIESIDAGASIGKYMNFASDRSMTQGYYSISVGMSYEDANKDSYSSSDTISVPIVQESRLVVDDILDPGWLTMSDQAYASVNYRNMGNNTINNLQISVEGDFTMESGSTYFVGNLASGKQDYYSFNFWPNQAGECLGRVTFTYEDADGEEHYLYKEFNFNIGEGYSYEEDPGEYIDPEPQGFTMPVWGWAAVAVGALIVLIIVIKIVKKHKAKKQEALDLDE